MAPIAAAAPMASPELTLFIDAQIDIVHALLALLAVVVASYGMLALASLIAYSPTRLSQFLEDLRRPDRDDRTVELDRRDAGYQVVAATLIAVGWAVGLFALQRAVDADSLPWALVGWVLLMLFVAMNLPIAVAEARPERTLLTVLPVLRAGWFVLRWPLVAPVLALTHAAARLMRLKRTGKVDPAEVQKQVIAAVADSVSDGALADAERTWIGNIIALKELQVSTVMTPRPDIVALPDTLTAREAVDQALEHGFSRYPVYRERLDEVVGIFYVKDALRLLQQEPSRLAATPLRELLREPLFVPETTGAAQLLRRIQTGNQHMAVVIDEYGTMVGLATVEDLLEEIVGDIGDEYDEPVAESPDDDVRIVEAGRVVELPGRTDVAEVNELLGTKLSEDGDWETVAGLVIASCNRIPLVGETVVVDDVEFRVLDADERRVQRLRVTALAPQHAEGA